MSHEYINTDPFAAEHSAPIQQPVWGETQFTRHFDSFEIDRLNTSDVADYTILAILNGDATRESSLYNGGFYPENKAASGDLFSPKLEGLLAFLARDKEALPVDAADGAQLGSFIDTILFYMQNGVEVPDPEEDDPNHTRTEYFTAAIARQMDQMVKSLKAAGWDVQTPLTAGGFSTAISEEVINRWYNIKENHNIITTLKEMVGYITAEAAAGPDKGAGVIEMGLDRDQVGYAGESMQRMLEIGYINRGTDLIFSQMEGLKDRQEIAKDALRVLTTIQNLHNQVIPEGIGDPADVEVWIPQPAGTLPSSTFVGENRDGVFGRKASLQDWLSHTGNTGTESGGNDGYSDKDFAENWEKIIEQYFQPLDVELDQSGKPAGNFLTDFQNAGDELNAIISKLGDERLDQAIEAVETAIEEGTLPGSIMAQLQSGTLTREQIIPDSISDITLAPSDPQNPGSQQILPPPYNEIIGVLQPFIRQEGTLEDSLVKVLADMGFDYVAEAAARQEKTEGAILNGANKTFVNLQAWIVDGWPSTGEPLSLDGVEDRSTIQNNLRTGMTAGSNLNDELKEELRKTLFIFEEFYKSASALLAKITQIIEKLAANSGR